MFAGPSEYYSVFNAKNRIIPNASSPRKIRIRMSTYRAREGFCSSWLGTAAGGRRGCGGAGRSEKIRVYSPLPCEDGG